MEYWHPSECLPFAPLDVGEDADLVLTPEQRFRLRVELDLLDAGIYRDNPRTVVARCEMRESSTNG